MASTQTVLNQFNDYPGGASQYALSPRLDAKYENVVIELQGVSGDSISFQDADVTVEYLPRFAPDNTEGSEYWVDISADVPSDATQSLTLEDTKVGYVRIKKDATGSYKVCYSQF